MLRLTLWTALALSSIACRPRAQDDLDLQARLQPVPGTVRFEDGTVLPVHNLERPQLLLDDDGRPQVLFLACSIDNIHDMRDGDTFNVHIPLQPGQTTED